MQHRQPSLTRKSSLTSNLPSSRIIDHAKYITKDEFDQMLNKHFLEAVDKLRYTLVETVNDMLNKSEMKDLVKERDYYRDKCEKLRESRYQDHQEFAKITGEYQKILVNACEGMLSGRDNPNRCNDTSRGLQNIGVLRRASSVVDVDANSTKRF